MYINITDSATANNKGSSGALVNYLEKENKSAAQQKPEHWFNQLRQDIEPYEVRKSLDSNVAKLCRDDAKFFLINISPSQKELRYLQEQYGMEGVKSHLKAYTEKVMDEYAKNFKRPGINSASNLLWFAKEEHYRYYGHKDKEVLEGTKKRGERKEGEQMHIQVIVSRKDWTNKIKLSPMNTSKGKNAEHSKKLGQFNRVAFKQSGEGLFDQLFGFERNLRDTMAYANIHKNGDLLQREQLDRLVHGTTGYPAFQKEAKGLATEIRNDHYKSTDQGNFNIGTLISGFLEVLFETPFVPGAGEILDEPAKRKKKKKRQDQGMHL